MTDRYAALRAALANATPGPWIASHAETEFDIETWAVHDVTDVSYEATLASLWSAEHDNAACAQYIAAADPATIADLLADYDAARKDEERLDWLLHRISGKELRRLGIITQGGGPLWGRVAIDAAMPAPPEATT